MEYNKVKLLKYTTIIEKLKHLEVIIWHMNIAKIQRDAYNYQRNTAEFLRGKLLIEVDFKQKIVVGLSPRQVSREYYNQISRSCLGK